MVRKFYNDVEYILRNSKTQKLENIVTTLYN